VLKSCRKETIYEPRKDTVWRCPTLIVRHSILDLISQSGDLLSGEEGFVFNTLRNADHASGYKSDGVTLTLSLRVGVNRTCDLFKVRAFVMVLASMSLKLKQEELHVRGLLRAELVKTRTLRSVFFKKCLIFV